MITPSKDYSYESIRADLERAQAMRSAALAAAVKTMLSAVGRLLCRSGALASLIPALLGSGAFTLILTATIQWLTAPVKGNFDTWMESWLIAWAMVTPVAYMVSVAYKRAKANLAKARRQVSAQSTNSTDARLATAK